MAHWDQSGDEEKEEDERMKEENKPRKEETRLKGERKTWKSSLKKEKRKGGQMLGREGKGRSSWEQERR